VALAALVGGLVVREPRPWSSAMLYPIRDLLGFLFWNASYLGNDVLWRGEVYELLRGGLMRNRSQAAARDTRRPARASGLDDQRPSATVS
jgi:ceramide glucosyltransferase